MSTMKLSPSVSEVLEAYFRLPEEEQKEVAELVRRANDLTLPVLSRAMATLTLYKTLRLTSVDQRDGRIISREERLTPAHRAIRQRMDEEEAIFVRNLERLMTERQLTQEELAQRVGVGQSAISLFLKRHCRPQRKTLGKLAVALEVDLETLWPGFREPWEQAASGRNSSV